jgi:hypothetical protein
VLADCPVAFWPLDDPPASASAADATGNGHPGTPTSGVTFGVPGLVTGGGRTAAQFDGAAGFVNVAEAPDLQFKTSLTIEVWIKASTLSGITGTRFLHKGTGDATGYALRATTGTNNHLQLELETWGSAFGSTLLSGDTRYYLAATYDGANVNVYVNGNLDGSSPANQSIQSSAGPLNIGRRGDGMGYFNGVMSGVAVYPRALTAAQILAHYNAGK